MSLPVWFYFQTVVIEVVEYRVVVCGEQKPGEGTQAGKDITSAGGVFTAV